MVRYIAAFFFVLSFTPAIAGENCTCRYKGQDVAEGQTICISNGNSGQMARCDRILNNTSWKFLGTACPIG